MRGSLQSGAHKFVIIFLSPERAGREQQVAIYSVLRVAKYVAFPEAKSVVVSCKWGDRE
jgi:hypothetical protein